VVDRAGCYRSAGVGGAITGYGFDLGIIDDPVKSREEADSPAVRERIWQWFTSDFYSRRSKDARILLVMTRWHRDDLAGRLLRQQANREADRWEVLSLPAIRTGGTGHPADPRADGEALWPDFLPVDELEKTRKQDPRAFAALYQQDPTTAGGSEWPIDYFGDWIWCPPEKWPRAFDLRVIAVDPSKGGKDKSHDYSAIVFVGVHRGLVYVDADLDRRPPHRIVEDTLRMCDRYKPDMLGFETNQFQELLVHEFERVCRQRMSLRWPVYKLVNKDVRIRRLGPYLVNREMRFKQDSPGCHLLVDQLIHFPHADHDDGPDALEMAVRRYLQALQAELRAIASRLVMPEFMLSSDASNANYSSTMVAEGPAVKMFERLQADTIWADLAVMKRVLRAAVAAGRLPENVLDLVDIDADGPSVQTRDRLKDAQADQILFTAGVMSAQTFAARHGLDYSVERKQLDTDREQETGFAGEPGKTDKRNTDEHGFSFFLIRAHPCPSVVSILFPSFIDAETTTVEEATDAT